MLRQKAQSKKMKTIISFVALGVLLLGGLVAAYFLNQQNQDTRNQASVADGVVEIAVQPKASTAESETIMLDVKVNTSQANIDGFQLIGTANRPLDEITVFSTMSSDSAPNVMQDATASADTSAFNAQVIPSDNPNEVKIIFLAGGTEKKFTSTSALKVAEIQISPKHPDLEIVWSDQSKATLSGTAEDSLKPISTTMYPVESITSLPVTPLEGDRNISSTSCPFMVPVECPEGAQYVPGQLDENKCPTQGQCVEVQAQPVAVTQTCPPVAEPGCAPGSRYIPGLPDANNCPTGGRCVADASPTPTPTPQCTTDADCANGLTCQPISRVECEGEECREYRDYYCAVAPSVGGPSPVPTPTPGTPPPSTPTPPTPVPSATPRPTAIPSPIAMPPKPICPEVFAMRVCPAGTERGIVEVDGCIKTYCKGVAPTPVRSCKYVYSSWTACENGVQRRSVVSTGENCAGSPELTRSCGTTVGELCPNGQSDCGPNQVCSKVNKPAEIGGGYELRCQDAPVIAWQTRASLPGDFNEDGNVNILDISYMIGQLFSEDSNADLNEDGIVDIVDYSLLLIKIKQQPWTAFGKNLSQTPAIVN